MTLSTAPAKMEFAFAQAALNTSRAACASVDVDALAARIGPSRARLHQHLLDSAMYAARDAAERARGHLLGAYLGVGPLREPTRYPEFAVRLANWPFEQSGRRLFDHVTAYRISTTRGPGTPMNTMVIAEPYLSPADVPRLLARWTPVLRPFGLTVVPLPLSWRIHAPWLEPSHVFLIGPGRYFSTPD